MPLPENYVDASTPTGALSELPATTARGLNAITHQINTNTSNISANTSAIAALGLVTPEQFGAVGNGTTDDRTALNNCFAAASGKTVFLDPSKIYAHNNTVTIGASHCTITGGGEIRATNTAGSTSAVLLTGNYVTIDGIKFTHPTASTRLGGNNDQKILHSGAHNTLRNVEIIGSMAGGCFNFGASYFLFDNCTATNTKADSFGNTNGAHDGTYRNCTTYNSGDDSFSTMAYTGDPATIYNLSYVGCKSYGSLARAFTVIGGDYISHWNCFAYNPAASGIYVGPDQTGFRAVNHINFDGGTLIGCCQNVSLGGYTSIQTLATGGNVSKVNIGNIMIRDTNGAAPGTLSVTNYGSPTTTIQDVWYHNIHIAGSPGSGVNQVGTITRLYQTDIVYNT